VCKLSVVAFIHSYLFVFWEVQLCYASKEVDKDSQIDEEAQDMQSLSLRSATPERVQQLVAHWSEYRTRISETQQFEMLRAFEELKPLADAKKVQKWAFWRKYATSYGTQYRLLLERSWKNNVREPALFRARLLQIVIISLLVGTLFLRLGHNQLGVRNRLAAIFITLTVAAFNGINAPIYIFPAERGVFMREKAAQTYSTVTYLLAKFTSDLPINTLLSVICGTFVYWLAGLNNSLPRWLVFTLIIFLTINIAFTLGWALSAFIVFGGFFINSNNVPVYFIWWQYVRIFR
jgi:hypothetical protein